MQIFFSILWVAPLLCQRYLLMGNQIFVQSSSSLSRSLQTLFQWFFKCHEQTSFGWPCLDSEDPDLPSRKGRLPRECLIFRLSLLTPEGENDSYIIEETEVHGVCDNRRDTKMLGRWVIVQNTGVSPRVKWKWTHLRGHKHGEKRSWRQRSVGRPIPGPGFLQDSALVRASLGPKGLSQNLLSTYPAWISLSTVYHVTSPCRHWTWNWKLCSPISALPWIAWAIKWLVILLYRRWMRTANSKLTKASL